MPLVDENTRSAYPGNEVLEHSLRLDWQVGEPRSILTLDNLIGPVDHFFVEIH